MRHSLTLAALTLLFGCRSISREPRSPQVAATRKAAVTDTARVPNLAESRGLGHPLGDSTELALIEELKTLYPVSDQAIFERQLKSATVVGMKTSNPKAQAILDRIFVRRKAWSDSVAAAMPKPVNIGPLLNVTVGLVDSLSDPTATGEIRRRTDIEPHDVILISRGHATVGAVEAAIHALGELWKADGQLTPSKTLNLMVYGEMHIESWTRFNEDMMRSQLMDAAETPKKLIPGIGNVGSFLIALRHHLPDPAKP